MWDSTGKDDHFREQILEKLEGAERLCHVFQKSIELQQLMETKKIFEQIFVMNMKGKSDEEIEINKNKRKYF